ncbi:hypothetical protein CAAN3_01S14840 [[Candida] anglica]
MGADDSFSLSFLDPSDVVGTTLTEDSPIRSRYTTPKSDSREQSLSTASDLSPINLEDLTTPSKNNESSTRQSYQSILKNSPTKTPREGSTSSGNNLGSARGRVLFSPTKEIRSFRIDSHHYEENEVDVTEEEQSDESDESELIIRRRGKSGDSSSSKKSKFNLIDPNTPYVLSLYLQFAFNFLVLSFVIYFLFIFIKTISSDVNHKIDIYVTNSIEEIKHCTREYNRNNCSPDIRAPVLEKSCTMWKKCMDRDPQKIGRSKVTAETLADIINGFLKPISWKSLVFINMLMWSVVATNVAFGSYRNSTRINSPKKNNDNDIYKSEVLRLRAQVAELESKLKLIDSERGTATLAISSSENSLYYTPLR